MTRHGRIGRELLAVLVIAGLLGAIASVGEAGDRVVYPYRYDPAEHPDYALRHYRGPTWESVGGRIHAPVDVAIGGINKITRVAGFDKNSFPADLDLDAEHGKIIRLREELGGRYVGAHVGESDAGFIHFNRRYEHPFSRLRERHYLSFADFLDSYGRVTDYQLSWGMNIGASHYAFAQGFVTKGNFQAHHPQPYAVIHAFLRGAAKQYGVLLHGGLTDTYQKTSEAFRRKNLQAHEKAKAKLAAMDPEKVTWKEKFDVMATLRRAREGLDPEGSPFSYSWRFWHVGYQYNLAGFRHLEGLTYRDSDRDREEREITALGRLHRHFQNTLLPSRPDPGGMYTPVACMADFFNGWIGKDYGCFRDHDGVAWDGIPFERGDYQLGNLMKLIHPDYRPDENRKDSTSVSGGFSRTPFGDCAEVILSDARPELMRQYGLIIAAGELRTELELLRAKLFAYLAQGGEVFLTARQAAVLWPEFEIGKQGRPIAPGSRLTVRVEGLPTALVESGPFTLCSIKPPARARSVITLDGRPVLVEMPSGKGTLTISLTPYGLCRKNEFAQGDWPVQFLDHVQAFLRHKLEGLKLFSVGDDLAYVVNRNVGGEYTLGVYNGQYRPLPMKIESHVGRIVKLEEIPTGDVELIRAEPRFYAPKGVKAGSWGSSGENRIGGGEVRMFGVRVDERDVRVLEKVRYPERPRGRFLAMGMRGLRRNIQLRPSFFQLFGGVKIDGRDLMATDDAALEYERGWYRVRHLDMLVDARPIDEEETLLAVIRKMALLPHARDLAVSRASAAVTERARKEGIRVHRAQDASIRWIEGGGALPGVASAEGKLVVLNLAYEDWDATCADVRRISTGQASTSEPLRGRPLPAEAPRAAGRAKKGGPFLAMRHVDDLSAWPARHPGFFTHFGGVMLDSDYLFQRSEGAWAEEAGRLKQLGLGVVVDFSGRAKMYRDISYQRSMPLARQGQEMFANVLRKMAAAGLREAVITPPNTRWDKQSQEAMKAYARMAAEKKVRLHLRLSHSLAKPSAMAAALKQVGQPNLRVGWNPLAESQGPAKAVNALPVDLILLAGQTPGRAELLPLHLHRDEANPTNALPLIDLAGKTVIFDPEYLDWNEAQRDADLWGQTLISD